MLSSSKTGTWATSFTGSQREVLHSRRRHRIASGLQNLELQLPALEVPDLVMAALADQHDRARDVREVAKLGRDEEASRAVELDLLGESDEEAFPQAELAVEAGEGHHLCANRFPCRAGIEQQAPFGVRGEYQLHRAPLRQWIANAGRHRHATLCVQIDLRCSLKHPIPHFFPLPHTLVSRLGDVKRGNGHFFLLRQRVSEGFSTRYSNVKASYFI